MNNQLIERLGVKIGQHLTSTSFRIVSQRILFILFREMLFFRSTIFSPFGCRCICSNVIISRSAHTQYFDNSSSTRISLTLSSIFIFTASSLSLAKCQRVLFCSFAFSIDSSHFHENETNFVFMVVYCCLKSLFLFLSLCLFLHWQQIWRCTHTKEVHTWTRMLL